MHTITISDAVGQLAPAQIDMYRAALAKAKAGAEPLTISEYARRYTVTHAIAEGTAYQYRIAAERLEAWAGRPILLVELDELIASAWLRDYGQTVKPATVRSKRNQLLALWRAAADEYLCDPPRRRVRTARVPWVPRQAWTLTEVRQLLEVSETLPRWHPCGLRRREWWPLAIRMAWDTGLRWGDLIAMRRDDIHDGRFCISQSKTGRPKAGRLKASTVAAIEASMERCPREVVVPWHATHEAFAAQVRLLVRKAGVRPGTWKWLRRASGSNVEAKSPGRGMAARHLGHAPGSRIAELNYIDPFIVEAAIPEIEPDDLDVQGAA